MSILSSSYLEFYELLLISEEVMISREYYWNLVIRVRFDGCRIHNGKVIKNTKNIWGMRHRTFELFADAESEAG